MYINANIKNIKTLIDDNAVSDLTAEKLTYQAYLREKGHHFLDRNGMIVLLNDNILSVERFKEITEHWIPMIMDDGSVVF